MTTPRDDLTRKVRGVSLCTVLSRVLGLVRDSVMATRFGNGPLLDAFTVAFRLPNLARALLGEGALATAFLPVYLREREAVGPHAARRLAAAVWIVLTAGLCLFVCFAELSLVMWGTLAVLTPELDLLRRLLIWLTPYLALICTSAQLAAILNAEQKFLVAALTPAALNVCWLIGLWWLPLWSRPEDQLFVMCAAVLAGGVVQVLMPALALRALGFRWEPEWRTALPIVRRILWQMAPIVGGLMITQINSLADSLIAWSFAAPPDDASGRWPLNSGTASALYFGQRLYQFPLGVFGVALGTVLYPRLAVHAQSRDYAALGDDLSLGCRYVLAIGLPAGVGLMLLSQPLAAACFQYGAFTADDTRTTAAMIAAYGSGVWAYCGLLILQRGFYALGDRQTPLRLGLLTVAANLLLSLSLIWWWGGIALAVTTSLVSMLQTLIALQLLRHKLNLWSLRPLGRPLVLASVCSLFMGAAGWGSGLLLETAVLQNSILAGRMGQVLLPFGAAVAVYLGTARALGFSEPFEILLRRHRSPAAASRSTH